MVGGDAEAYKYLDSVEILSFNTIQNKAYTCNFYTLSKLTVRLHVASSAKSVFE